MKVVKVKRLKPTIEAIAKPPARMKVREYAELLKERSTESERLYCRLLDHLKIDYEFQPVICGYIPDFLFPARKRIIELDGKFHKLTVARDARRDAVLRKAGYRVLRVQSSLIFTDVDRLVEITREFVFGGRKKVGRIKRRKRCKYALGPDESYEAFLQATAGL